MPASPPLGETSPTKHCYASRETFSSAQWTKGASALPAGDMITVLPSRKSPAMGKNLQCTLEKATKAPLIQSGESWIRRKGFCSRLSFGLTKARHFAHSRDFQSATLVSLSIPSVNLWSHCQSLSHLLFRCQGSKSPLCFLSHSLNSRSSILYLSPTPFLGSPFCSCPLTPLSPLPLFPFPLPSPMP